LRTLKGHSGSVNSVAFSPDGKTLASGGGDNTVKLWEVSTGTELRTLKGHSGAVFSVAFSPDRKTLASGGGDNTVKLWEVATGTELRTLKGHSLSIFSVAFSPDGNTLASGSWDKTVKLWDVSTGEELRTLKGHSDSVGSVTFSPDGKTVASGGEDHTIKLWDVTSGTELRTLTGHFSVVFSVAFSPDGKTLASGSGDKTVKLWEVSTGTELRTLKGHSGWVDSVAFSPDGKTLASGSDDQTIKLWEVSTGTELRTLKGHSNSVVSVAFSPDGKTLASGSVDTVKLWDVSTATELHTLKGDFILVRSVAFSPDGKTLASGMVDGTVKLWDVSTGTDLHTLKGHSDQVESVAFSPDGKILASGSLDHTIKLWDVSTGAELRTFKGHSDQVESVAFSPDGKTLASGSMDTVKLWDVSTATELHTLKGDFILVRSVAFSPDGKTLATGSWDDTVRLWAVSTGTELRALEGHSGLVFSVAFSPDGKTLASGSDDNTVKLWDVSTGTELRTLKGHSSYVTSVAFSLNNKYLVSGSRDTTIKVWEVTSGKELASLIAFDEHDWIVVTPDGLFDGSTAAWKQILWRYNTNTFDVTPVEAYFSEFYYPGLLTDIFAGKRPKAEKDIKDVDRRQIPVKLVTARKEDSLTLVPSRTVTLQVEVEEAPEKNPGASVGWWPASGARDLRLFRNGSLVKLWQGDLFALGEKDGCKLQSQATPQSPRHCVCIATVPIISGPNKFTAYAFNRDNIKSQDATLTITGADSLKRKGTLHILAVGVSQYANREYNLDYTTDDATSLASQLKLQQEKLGRYESVEIKTLLNESATKANILAELKKLAASVQPEDGVVVYFSGHGKASGDHFYLVPHDLGYSGSRDQLSDDGLQQILAHSISDLELEEAFRGIDAGQMFMIIDACNSGQALENKDEPRRGPMNTRGLAQLAYEKGMYILTASQNVEEAFVSERLKHSYLTHALVEEGLKTKAADADHNGEVTLREWFDYALARVPKLREETLQRKSLEEVTPKLKAVRTQKSQTPRVFYRREPDAQPMIVATVH
jgi:WD40 repeat protein